ncbi:MAG: hypothetical protein IPF92_19900 [Myxococcales bacterium]|nr:hypothetical protein [Myxococcales bacterium]MBL0194414.1 hypothetical protein [Myxococcales bacterium]HQY60828.1 hypothetical protein [Polyangiaceae bacterium]
MPAPNHPRPARGNFSARSRARGRLVVLYSAHGNTSGTRSDFVDQARAERRP